MQPAVIFTSGDRGMYSCGKTHPHQPDGRRIQRAWMLKVDEYGCLIPGCHLLNSAEELEDGQAELAIYPNPVRDFLNFHLRGIVPQSGGEFRIVDVSGALIKTLKAGNLAGTYIVPAEGWPVGTYFLQYLQGNSLLLSQPFIKQ